MKYDVLIIGTGLFGLTIAERLVHECNKNVLIIDKRNHIGGNCYSEFDAETGIEYHKYGAHLFHTSLEDIWEYVNRFTNFTNYTHRVYTTHDGIVYPLPINLGTINQFFNTAYTPNEAKELISKQAASAPKNPKNLAKQGISLIGEPLFNAFIKNYTAKQWQTPAEELSPNIIKRLPVRYNYDNRYFNDTHEGLPTNGYAAWFQNIVESCGNKLTIRLETDFFKDDKVQNLHKNGIFTVYTGPIDQYYNYQFGELSWRSLKFEKEIVNVDDFQGCPVMNYADLEPTYTRIHEFKHFHPERKNNPNYSHTSYADGSNKTVIVREYSKTWHRGEEPYYPVNTPKDHTILKQYQALASTNQQTIFGGRLGEYAYYDMDKTIAAALAKFEEIRPRI